MIFFKQIGKIDGAIRACYRDNVERSICISNQNERKSHARIFRGPSHLLKESQLLFRAPKPRRFELRMMLLPERLLDAH